MEGLGSLHPFWGPLPAFLLSFLAILLLRPAGMATGCLSIATYTVYPLLAALGICLDESNQQILLKLTALLFLGLLTFINCYSVNLGVGFSVVCTVVKLSVILILIGCGFYQLCYGKKVPSNFKI